MITLTAPALSRCCARVPGPPTAADRPDPAPLARRPVRPVLVSAPRDEEAVLVADLDLDQRRDWLELLPFLLTRRPDTYTGLTARWLTSPGAGQATRWSNERDPFTAGTVWTGPARSPMRSWWSTAPSVRWAAGPARPRPESMRTGRSRRRLPHAVLRRRPLPPAVRRSGGGRSRGAQLRFRRGDPRGGQEVRRRTPRGGSGSSARPTTAAWRRAACSTPAGWTRWSPTGPVALRAWDYHTMWVNTAALERAGITPDTPTRCWARFRTDRTARCSARYANGAQPIW